jgi:hypothetical protein
MSLPRVADITAPDGSSLVLALKITFEIFMPQVCRGVNFERQMNVLELVELEKV